MKANNFSTKMAKIVLPVDHRVNYDSAEGSSPEGKLCLAYECTEDSYIELPFLDPVNDLTRINNFFNFVSLFSWMDYC